MGYAVSWVDSIAAPRPRRGTRRSSKRSISIAARRTTIACWPSAPSWIRCSGGMVVRQPVRALGRCRALRSGRAGQSRSSVSRASRCSIHSPSASRTSKPVLVQGQATPWIEFPGGFAKLKLVLRGDPDPVEMANRMATESRITLERNQRKAYDKLRQRYPVEILDPQLRLVDLPELPDSS